MLAPSTKSCTILAAQIRCRASLKVSNPRKKEKTIWSLRIIQSRVKTFQLKHRMAVRIEAKANLALRTTRCPFMVSIHQEKNRKIIITCGKIRRLVLTQSALTKAKGKDRGIMLKM